MTIIDRVYRYGIKAYMLNVLYLLGMIPFSKVHEQRVQFYYSKLDEDGRKECLREWFRNQGFEDDIDTPNTFNGKIQWLKLYDNLPIKAELSDKYAVRKWVEETIGDKYLIPIIDKWDKVEEINYDDLPEKFVFKANHASGMNYVIKNKTLEDWARIQKKLKNWTKSSFGWFGMELQYTKIKRCIIAEEYIEELDGGLLDYKVHCFGGEPQFIQVIGDRDLVNHTGKQANYDFEWKRLNWIFEDYPEFDYVIEKPEKLKELYDVSKKLAEQFKYVRVDLYIINDEIKFGEMTFTPNNGIYSYQGTWTKEKDIELGKLINIGN